MSKDSGNTASISSITVDKYAPSTGTFDDPTEMDFLNRNQVVTTGTQILYRRLHQAQFKTSPLASLSDAHAITYSRRNGLYYVTNTANNLLVALRSLVDGRVHSSVGSIAGVPLFRPHDIKLDRNGWLYSLNPGSEVNAGDNPKGATIFRFRGFGEQESSINLSRFLGYSRSLYIARGQIFVVGSSTGNVAQIDDFERGDVRVFTSYCLERKNAYAGCWDVNGLLPNGIAYIDGFWYVTSYFSPNASEGHDPNTNKLVRFRTWEDFESGNWEDISALLPANLVPYFMTSIDNAIYLAMFQDRTPFAGAIYRLQLARPVH